MKNITLLFFITLFSFFVKIQAQCNRIETITICDMTSIDNDNNGTPDGIINLYEEYNAITGSSISIATGTWFDPNFNFALNEATGDLYLWDLDNASTSITDYQFQFIDSSSSCSGGVLATVNLILGPFSGYARPVLNIDDVNLEVCDLGSTPQERCFTLPDVDLFEALESIPSPHLNGQWIYNGSSPNFVSLSGSEFTVTIPYNSGPPLVDQETFELIYRINGIAPCDFTLQTTVNVSVTRQVFSGYGQAKRICELDILNGFYDTDIDLTNDAFLLQEDLEGVWSTDTYGQITSPRDSSININNIYQQIIANRGLRFGCEELEFTYSVDQRSGVCEDAESVVSFKIYEYLRPFKQNDNVLEFCEDAPTEPSSINLYNQLEFTTEGGILFDYYDDDFTNWEFISGPSRLGLVSNNGSLNYSASGTINLQNAPPGNYVFEYRVSSGINCPNDLFVGHTYDSNSCIPIPNNNGFCNSETAQVVLTIHPKLYAGEDTMGLEFCETDPIFATSLDLFTLMTTNGVDNPIYQGSFGTWTDRTGNIVSNIFTIPQINDRQVFDFVYTTTNSNGCIDRASLSFTVFEEYNSGISTTINVCDSNTPFNLFDRLDGDPSTTGTWAGPNGFSTTDQNAIFDPLLSDAGVYIYAVPDNVNDLGDILCSGSQSTVTVTLHQSPNAGIDGLYVVCQSDLQIDLLDYLGVDADSGGEFRDLSVTNALAGSILDVSRLSTGRYNFQYEIQGHSSCSLSTSLITISIEEVEIPITTNQIFCATEGATVANLNASNGLDFNWYETETSTSPLPSNILLVDGEDYFVAALDSDNCESSRVSMIVTILPVDHVDCNDCIKDGVSANNDGENDEFSLCNLPISYPNFEINIFNRYGSLVYKGNKNTPLFNGSSNVSLTMGNKLPSGVYFYVFDPKDGETKPFQGNFYLSR